MIIQILLVQASQIILALDNDSAGNTVAEELARRLGKARCARVNFPRDELVS